MYIKTNQNNCGNVVFVSQERTDNFQITNTKIYYNRFSISTKASLENMGRFRIQLSVADNTWSSRYNILKNIRYSDSSTDWTLVSLCFKIKI